MAKSHPKMLQALGKRPQVKNLSKARGQLDEPHWRKNEIGVKMLKKSKAVARPRGQMLGKLPGDGLDKLMMKKLKVRGTAGQMPGKCPGPDVGH